MICELWSKLVLTGFLLINREEEKSVQALMEHAQRLDLAEEECRKAQQLALFRQNQQLVRKSNFNLNYVILFSQRLIKINI